MDNALRISASVCIGYAWPTGTLCMEGSHLWCEHFFHHGSVLVIRMKWCRGKPHQTRRLATVGGYDFTAVSNVRVGDVSCWFLNRAYPTYRPFIPSFPTVADSAVLRDAGLKSPVQQASSSRRPRQSTSLCRLSGTSSLLWPPHRDIYLTETTS